MRKVSDELLVSTLFGLDVAKKKCSTCGEVKYINEFYTKSKTVRNRVKTRAQCISCWSEFKGRTWLKKYCEEV